VKNSPVRKVHRHNQLCRRAHRAQVAPRLMVCHNNQHQHSIQHFLLCVPSPPGNAFSGHSANAAQASAPRSASQHSNRLTTARTKRAPSAIRRYPDGSRLWPGDNPARQFQSCFTCLRTCHSKSIRAERLRNAQFCPLAISSLSEQSCSVYHQTVAPPSIFLSHGWESTEPMRAIAAFATPQVSSVCPPSSTVCPPQCLPHRRC